MINMIIKRDGRIVPYDETRIRTAIALSVTNIDETDLSNIISNIMEKVNSKLNELDDSFTAVDIETVQDIVVSSMKECGYSKIAKNFTAYRNKRTHIREKKSNLMRSIKEVAVSSSMGSDAKRENGNINGDTAMGTMLKFGTTTSKEYYLNDVIPDYISNAHREGYIHIHDLDFFGLTTTCLTADTKILLKVNNRFIHTTFSYFDDYFSSDEDSLEYLNGIEIFYNGSFTPIKWCSRRKVKDNEIVYNVSNKFDNITMTETHQVPIVRNGEQVLVQAKDIRIGDSLIYTDKVPELLYEINCIDLFKDIDIIVIKNTALLRKLAHEHHFIEEFYRCLNCPDTSTKYMKSISIREYLRVRHLFTDILDEHELLLDVKQGHSVGYSPYIKLDSDLGKLIGYVYSEGYVRTISECQNVTFTNKNESMIEEFVYFCNKLFNVVPSKSKKGNCWDITINKAYIAQLFNGPFGVKENSYNIFIPDWIYFANNDFLNGFFSGLIDGDGTVDNQFTTVRYGTSCKTFAENLHELLYLHGINSVISERLFEGTTAQFGNTSCIRKSNHYILTICGHYVDDLCLTKSILYNNNKKDVNRVPKKTLQNFYVNKITSVDYDGFVYDIETDSHYFTANSFVVHNCTQIDIGKLLANGFSTGHGYLRTPTTINTAAALACIAIQSNQNDQHGGQSIPTFDYGLAPYVVKSFIKNICEYLDNNEVVEDDIKNIKEQLKEYSKSHKSLMSESSLYDVEHIIYNTIGDDYVIPVMCINKAIQHTDRDTYQAMEAVVHNLNSMNSRAGSQVPFSSLNFGTDTSVEGRMVSKNLMLAQEAGLGNGETPIFPILIFKVKEGVNYNPNDPNYDLFELACRVSAKRLFPNFCFIDAPYNLQYYKPNQPDTEVATMGCVDGKETVIYKYNDTVYNESFEQFYNRISNDLKPVKVSEDSTFYSTDNLVSIYDTFSDSFVNCVKLIKNTNVNKWVRITISNAYTLDCTIDHPIPIFTNFYNPVRIFAEDIEVGDSVRLSNYFSMNEMRFGTVTSVEFYDDNKCSYDVETESDMFDVSNILSHNCRTRVIGDITALDNQIVTGRGNLSFTSINLPRLAIESNGDINKFYELLDSMLNLVKEQLLHRYKIQCARTVKNYPFLMGQGVWMDSEKLNINDTLEDVLKHGTLSIGFIGLAETLISLIGKHHGESEEAQKLGLEIIGHMREYTDKLSEEYQLNFSLLATPAESLSGRFVKIDKKRYGIIKGVTDKDYYTNSVHVPVYYPISAYKKIQIEAPYHNLCNAGHICYVELDGDPSNNIEAFESVVRCMKESGIGYGSINHPVDRDPVCGYVGIINDVCPCCGRKEGEAITPAMYKEIIAKNRMGGVYGKQSL